MAMGDYSHGTHLFLAGQGQNYNIKSGLATASIIYSIGAIFFIKDNKNLKTVFNAKPNNIFNTNYDYGFKTTIEDNYLSDLTLSTKMYGDFATDINHNNNLLRKDAKTQDFQDYQTSVGGEYYDYGNSSYQQGIQ